MASVTTTAIASLEPGLDADSTSIAGIVTLIWPYASSSQTLSLLLVEPDFRLRRNRGQVRIYFLGASAKAVAKAHVASGDQLLLGLKGVDWAKDESTASTPGKGVEWALRYGERLVVQIQRVNQEPISLDIDHPAPSPEPPAQTPTPRFSPPYNSHIPTTVQRRQLDAQSWASPAFLKRSTHLAPSAYDPFAEEDFPDNDRRKRTKFGRGSDQWRFTDRTPSPEKEPEATTPDSSSPSKLPIQHRKVLKEVTPPVGVIPEAEVQEIRSSGNDAKALVTEVVESHLDASPQSPATTESRPPDIGSVDQAKHTPQSPLSESARTVASPPQSPASDAGAEVQDGGRPDQEMIDVPLSEGLPFEHNLDESASLHNSTARPALGKKNQEDKDQAGVDNEANQTPNNPLPLEESISTETDEAIVEQQATIPETAHEFQLPDSAESHPVSTIHDHQQAAQLRSSPIHTSSDHLDSEITPDPESVSSKEEDDEDTIRKRTEDDSLEQDDTLIRSKEDTEQRQLPETEHVSVAKEFDKEGEVRPLKAESKDEQGKHSAVRNEEQRLTLSQISIEQGHKKLNDEQKTDVPPTETKVSTVEIIDLESEDDEEVDQANLQGAASSMQGSPQSAVKQIDSRVETLSETEAQMDKDVDYNRPGADMQEHIDDREREGRLPQPSIRVQGAKRLREPGRASNLGDTVRIGDRYAPLQAEDIIVPSVVPTEQLSKTKPPQEATPAEQLPSIVPETLVDRSLKSQLMTPDATQQMSVASEHSFSSIRSEQGDETLPTPRLTQGNSAGIKLPESPTLQSSQESVVGGEPAPVREDVSLTRKTRSSPRKAKEKTQVPKTIIPAAAEEISTPQRPPTFIEELKAMRKLAAQSPRRVSDSTATSPWFAPKELSQVVPDSEAESEAETSSDPERKAAQEETDLAAGSTPQKQKPLAASFMRTPQRNGITSIQSSPGYLPPSQPPPPGFRTDISYYVPLATLTSHFGTTVDVLVIALSSTPVTRATIGPKDYNQTLYITDPVAHRQMPNAPVVTVQIFRPGNKCFPIIKKGDAILLRDFKVQTFQRQAMLLSTQSSAWAVFRKSAPSEVQIRGSPVELGPEERMFAQGLWRWRDNLTQVEKEILDQKLPKEPPMLQNEATKKEKKTTKKPAVKQKQAIEANGDNAKTKKEGIKGLGVDLPGSQSSPVKKGKRASQELSVEKDTPIESTEPPRRVLRPRGVRGMAGTSESPARAIDRTSGTVFTDGLGEPEK